MDELTHILTNPRLLGRHGESSQSPACSAVVGGPQCHLLPEAEHAVRVAVALRCANQSSTARVIGTLVSVSLFFATMRAVNAAKTRRDKHRLEPAVSVRGRMLQAYRVHAGLLLWPLPLRASGDTHVPDWVDSPPTDSARRTATAGWSGSGAWRRSGSARRKTRRCDNRYTARCSGAISLRSGPASCCTARRCGRQRRRPPSSRLLSGVGASAAFSPIDWSPARPKACEHSARLVRRLDPVSSAYRRVHNAPHYYPRDPFRSIFPPYHCMKFARRVSSRKY